MTYAPATLRELQTAMKEWTGLSAVSLGIVGDAAHAKRASYHNGRDRIVARCGASIPPSCDYSARTTRDRTGLSDAAMAIDIGNFRGLREMSKWLVAEARKNAPGTRDIREIIYTDNGVRVLRWDRERGYASAPQSGEADSSHLWHTHVSYYRDSESRNKVDVFERYFGGSETVRTFNVPEFPGRNATPKEDASRPGNSVWLYSNSDLKPDGTEISLKPIRALQVVAMEIVPGVTALAYEPQAGDAGTLSKVVFVARTNIARSGVNPLPDCAECQTQLAAAQASVASLGSRIATIKNTVAANAAEIAKL